MTYALDIVNLAIAYLSQQIRKVKIAELLKVSRQTIHDWGQKNNKNN